MNYKGSNKFGVLPRRTVIANQPHMLAYINPQEEMLLRQLGGTGQAGPMGVPAYPPGDGGFSPDGGGGYGGGGGFGGFGGSESPGGGGGGYNDAVAAAQQQAAANAAAMAAADAAIAGQMAAAAQEEANAAAMAEANAAAIAEAEAIAKAEAEAIAIQDPSDIPTGSITTSIVGTPMFENMKNLMAQEEAKNNIGSSGYVSVDAMANTTPDVGFVPDNYTPDLGGYIGTIDDDGLPNVDVNESDFIDNPYAIDIQDTNIYTLNEDGTYTIEDGEPDPEPDFDPNEFIGGPGDGPDNVTTTTDTLPSSFDRVEYNFNTSLDPSQYGGMWSNITSTIPKYEFNAYEDEDGLLRFSENDELVPEDILKYMPYAKKTLVEEETEEEEEETETEEE
jgi:hypothetical protein